MANQKPEVDLSSLLPLVKPYLPMFLRGLSKVHTAIVVVGAIAQRLHEQENGGKDALPIETPEQPLGKQSSLKTKLADGTYFEWEGK